jgi:hypothetical protein
VGWRVERGWANHQAHRDVAGSAERIQEGIPAGSTKEPTPIHHENNASSLLIFSHIYQKPSSPIVPRCSLLCLCEITSSGGPPFSVLSNIDVTMPSSSEIKCCCGRDDCAFLQHNTAALEELEKDVETAARLGQVGSDLNLICARR